MSNPETKALMAIIDHLKPLESEVRRRTVDAAMTFLGETIKPPARDTGEGAAAEASEAEDEGTYSKGVRQWMKKYDVTGDQMDRVFLFKEDGSFDIHDVPSGSSKKEQTLNTYILTGLGAFLSTGERKFDDATARNWCKRVGCYDEANHSSTVKGNKGGEFSGDKKPGYTITNIGLKRGAELVKELAGAGS
jgi:hypothetical protein